MPANIKLKRVYESPAKSDGKRVLVDRLWPRGLTKEAAKLDYWAKPCSPSSELRKWYQHDPAKWEEFKVRYFAELDGCAEGVEELSKLLTRGTVTFLYSCKESELNNAVALKQYVQTRRRR